ncbi:MAG: hypothetical protein ABW182_05340 [Sphingomonas sp.]
MAMPSGTLKIWLNAFIPYHVQGYTRKITKGETAGLSAVPLPGIARLNIMNWDHDWDSGFLTDQRKFSSNETASVRMQSAVTVDVSATGMKPRFHPMRTSGTTGVKLNTGKIVGKSNANMKNCVFKTEEKGFQAKFGRPLPSGLNRILVLNVKGAASDPLVSASADIDYKGHFKIVQSDRNSMIYVEFQGKIDAFPAFECYASWNGKVQTLFTAPPPAHNTVVDLLGGANRRISGCAEWC